jgi:small-conductance mechanosensitive channel
MKLRQTITAFLLVVLVAAAIAGILWTRPLPTVEQEVTAAGGKLQAHQPRFTTQPQRQGVDLRPLETAQRLGAMAGSEEEKTLAHQAAKVADHEVDLSFFDALRMAELSPPPLSPEAKQIADRKSRAQQRVTEDQESVADLTRRLTAAPQSQKDNLQDQIDVAKAQMDLDQNELDDIAAQLEQAGGDPQAKIKRLQEQHEASDHNAATVGSAVNPHEQDYQARTLLTVFRAWQALRSKQAALVDAQKETADKRDYLNKKHDELAAKVAQDKASRDAIKQQARGFVQGKAAATRDESKTAATTALASLKQYTLDQKNLADRGRRLQDEEDLGELYATWIEFVEARERAALHNMIQCVLWILLVVVAVYVANRLIEHLFTGMSAENKRIDTLRAVVKFAAEAVGAIVILFIILGMPTQTTTVLGLAGAGLTVAMKDFIVAFFGWFVLMGKNGIRVGDWVEINGVGGEVVEVGLLKTVLLETGSWTDAGHPTGRRVSFVNSFAIEGHFFNFTTSGQWMWDQLQVLIPSGQDPYPIIDGVQKLVEKETQTNAGKAEAEWKEVTAKYRVQTLSAVPGINVLPTAAGIEVHVRYITRAFERYEARKRLYEAVVELMHGKRDAVKA